MPDLLYAELTTVIDGVAEFTVFDDNDNKQCYTRCDKQEVPGDPEPGEVYTVTLDSNDDITAIEFNQEKTTEFQTSREDIMERLN